LSALIVARTLIAQTKFFQRHCAKHIRIANATLREVDDFLGDNSCRWIVTNFQMQRFTRRCEGSGHSLNDLRVKGLMSKIRSYRHTSPGERSSLALRLASVRTRQHQK